MRLTFLNGRWRSPDDQAECDWDDGRYSRAIMCREREHGGVNLYRRAWGDGSSIKYYYECTSSWLNSDLTGPSSGVHANPEVPLRFQESSPWTCLVNKSRLPTGPAITLLLRSRRPQRGAASIDTTADVDAPPTLVSRWAVVSSDGTRRTK